MSDAELTEELDNYGVWVKKGPETVDSSDSSPTIDSSFDIDMNLPDFSDLDISEDGAENSANDAVDVTDSFLSDLDTDLSDLTADSGTTDADAPVADESATSGETEEISLDEFIAGGDFEDVAEGNRGYGQAEAPAPEKSAPASSGGEESISLDDFLDGDSFSDAPAEASAPAPTSADDGPIDIDLSFDDSADSLPTATVEADVSFADDSVSVADTTGALAGTESVDLSAFGFGDDDSAPADTSAETAASGETESVDLADFGFGDDTVSEPAPEAAAEPVATQTDSASSSDSFDDMFNSIGEDTAVDASAFFDEAEPSAETAAPTESAASSPASESAAGGDEEVDLSDFGFDDDSLASQGEVKDDTRATPIGSVDYEMNVIADDDLPPAPSAPEPVVERAAPAPEPAPISETSDSDFDADALLDTVIDETADAAAEVTVVDTAAFDDIPAPEPVDIPSDDFAIPEATETPSALEGEDTLSTDELANIVGTADFQTEDAPAEADDFAIPEATETPSALEGEDTLSTDELANIVGTADFQTEDAPAEETVREVPVASETAQAPESTGAVDAIASPAATAILSQIVGELTSLKNEIAGLKSDFEEMRNREVFPPAKEAPIPVPEESSGFFDGMDEDETIALSTDELANIMNTADFQTEDSAEEPTTEPLTEETTTDDTATTEALVTEEPIAEPDSEEPGIEDIVPEAASVVPVGEESLAEAPVIERTLPVAEEPVIEDAVTDETLVEPLAEEPIVEEPIIEDVVIEEAPAEPIGEESVAEEPVADVTIEEPIVETPLEEALPVEEEAATADDGLLDDENRDNGLVFDADKPLEEPALDDFNFDAIDSDSTEDDTRSLPDEISVPKVDDVLVDESEAADSVTESEVISEDSLSYLSADTSTEELAPSTATEQTAPSDTALSGDLKQEIKSVLSYMDKLLENLPEEKIAEFAQSEQFETYKKLFKELGLA